MKTLLSYLISSRGFTQKQICDQIEAMFGEESAVSQSTLSSASLGHPMRPSTAKILAEFFKVPQEALQFPVGGPEEAQQAATAEQAAVEMLDADERAWKARYTHRYDDGSTDEVDIAHAMCLEEALATAYSLLESEATPPVVYVAHLRRGLRLSCASLAAAAYRKRRADTNA